MAATKLEARWSQHGAWTVLALDGDVDMASTPRVEAALTSEVDAGVRRLAIDLRNVGFMDSTGLTALFRSHEDVVAEGGALVLVCATGPVRRVIEVSGVGALVSVYESFDELPAA